jgi:hypothetical protein
MNSPFWSEWMVLRIHSTWTSLGVATGYDIPGLDEERMSTTDPESTPRLCCRELIMSLGMAALKLLVKPQDFRERNGTALIGALRPPD